MTRSRKALLLYAPVLHAGYVKLFAKMKRAQITTCLLLGQAAIDDLSPLHPEIRAITPDEMRWLLLRGVYFSTVELIDNSNAAEMSQAHRIIAVNDAMTRAFAEKTGLEVEQWENVFLRWDESSVAVDSNVSPDRISHHPVDQRWMELARELGRHSPDWWRQVGAILLGPSGEPLFRCSNTHVPSEQVAYSEGDPRDFIPAGVRTDIATSLHCEQQVVLWAAQEQGRSLRDCSLVITDFPCPVCAKLVAYSGISQVYFGRGHASLDGERVLRDQKVQMILVQ